MTSSEEPPTRPSSEAELARSRSLGVGCFMAFLGFWSGGMVFVLLGKVIEGARKSPSCEGLLSRHRMRGSQLFVLASRAFLMNSPTSSLYGFLKLAGQFA